MKLVKKASQDFFDKLEAANMAAPSFWIFIGFFTASQNFPPSAGIRYMMRQSCRPEQERLYRAFSQSSYLHRFPRVWMSTVQEIPAARFSLSASTRQDAESYDFSGKTVVTFATSGGSGMGQTLKKLAPSCPGAKLVEGKVFRAGTGREQLAAWAEGLGL